MKKIIICDSGLGGLDIARKLFHNPASSEAAEVIYFNAFPDAKTGYNDMSPEEQQTQFRMTIESMKCFAPSLLFIACNTLSIIYDRLRQSYTPPFPVAGITDCTANMMADFLHRNCAAVLLITGTATTVGSRFYQQNLIARGLESSRLYGLPLPGLARLLESGPAAPEVRRRIAGGATQAAAMFPAPRRLGIALCCTHYGYADAVWREEFSRCFPETEIVLLNPNDLCAAEFRATGFSYHARLELFPGAAEHLVPVFDADAPPIARALRSAHAETALFPVIRKTLDCVKSCRNL